MKKLQTFEGFMDFFKDKFKMALDRVNDNLKDIPGIERKDYPPVDNTHRFPKPIPKSCDWFWREKIEGVDFDFVVKLRKDKDTNMIQFRVSVTKVPGIKINNENFYSTNPTEVAAGVKKGIEQLKKDCKDFILAEEFYEDYPKSDIKDLCQDLIDFCDSEYELDKISLNYNQFQRMELSETHGWVLRVPIKRDKESNIDSEFLKEIEMLRQNLESVGLMMTPEQFPRIVDERDKEISLTIKEKSARKDLLTPAQLIQLRDNSRFIEMDG